MSVEETTIRMYCNECSGAKNHNQVAVFKETGSVECIDWEYIYQIFQCGGCGTVSYRTREYCSEDQDPPYDNIQYRYNYYPPRESRPRPTWFHDLPDSVRPVLDEVYNALDTGSRYLAAVGIRTVLDLIMVDKIGDIGGFQQKIDELVSKQYITAAERTVVEAVTEAGNASAHRGYAPDSKALAGLMDILERLLEKFYIDEIRQEQLVWTAEAIKRRVPPRVSRRSAPDPTL